MLGTRKPRKTRQKAKISHLAEQKRNIKKRNPLKINQLDFSNVGIADEISNIKFIEDFDKIVNFMLAMSHA